MAQSIPPTSMGPGGREMGERQAPGLCRKQKGEEAPMGGNRGRRGFLSLAGHCLGCEPCLGKAPR